MQKLLEKRCAAARRRKNVLWVVIGFAFVAVPATGLLLWNENKPAAPAALFDAARQGNLNQMQGLLDRGIDVDGRDQGGLTALLYAAHAGHPEVVTLLLERGADINVKGVAGDTPLMKAARKGHAECVTLLLGKGSDPFAKDREGWTVLHYAVEGGNSKIVQLLLNMGVPAHTESSSFHSAFVDSPLETAANWQAWDIVGMLLQHGAVGNTRTLRLAARAGNAEVVRLLLQQEAHRHQTIFESFDETLVDAASAGHLEVVRSLLDAGADIEARSFCDRSTALMKAAENGHADVVKLLLERGAVDSKHEARNRAQQTGHTEVLRLLESHAKKGFSTRH
jgi:ankyrin repeat protein